MCFLLHELSKRQSCCFCGAPPSFCCYNGQVLLSTPQVLIDLYNLCTFQSDEIIEFWQHVRAYNSIFSFTSFIVKLDRELIT